MYAPVMLFTYSRPTHTRRVLEALAENTLAKETDVYAYTCLPKNESHRESVDATKDVLREYASTGRFRTFTIVDKPTFRPLGPEWVFSRPGVPEPPR